MYKITSLIVDFVLGIWQRVPGPVIHNLDKARMLKKIMWHLNVDGVNGDYFEFGVAHGHSMRAAQQAVKHSHSNKLGVKQIQRQLFGFDTFDKFIGGGRSINIQLGMGMHSMSLIIKLKLDSKRIQTFI